MEDELGETKELSFLESGRKTEVKNCREIFWRKFCKGKRRKGGRDCKVGCTGW